MKYMQSQSFTESPPVKDKKPFEPIDPSESFEPLESSKSCKPSVDSDIQLSEIHTFLISQCSPATEALVLMSLTHVKFVFAYVYTHI